MKKQNIISQVQLTTTTMCTPCISFVQFPGIQPGDIITNINGIGLPAGYTATTLVANNPQFWFEFGNTGVNTLCSSMVIGTVDLVLMYTNGGPIIPCTAIPLTDHPIHRPK